MPGLPFTVCCPVASSAVGPELIRCRKPPAASPVKFITGHPLHSFRAPVCPHVREHLRLSGQKVPKQHGYPIERVIFCRHDIGLADAVPVKG